MKRAGFRTFAATFSLVLTVFLCENTFGDDRPPWYAGEWDSGIYNRAEKPRTVALRVEVVDAETGLPVPGALVEVTGDYLEEVLGPAGDGIALMREPERRDFGLSAMTDGGGVAVLALGWEKEFPWRFGRPAPAVGAHGNLLDLDIRRSWTRAVDDVEKVRQIVVRHPSFHFREIPFNFDHLLRFGQNPNSEFQDEEVVDAFDEAWQDELTQDGVIFGVLDFGRRFDDFQNRHSTRAEFFEKVRDMDFAATYRRPTNLFSPGLPPQSQSGPYLVYLVRIELGLRHPVLGVVEVYIPTVEIIRYRPYILCRFFHFRWRGRFGDRDRRDHDRRSYGDRDRDRDDRRFDRERDAGRELDRNVTPLERSPGFRQPRNPARDEVERDRSRRPEPNRNVTPLKRSPDLRRPDNRARDEVDRDRRRNPALNRDETISDRSPAWRIPRNNERDISDRSPALRIPSNRTSEKEEVERDRSRRPEPNRNVTPLERSVIRPRTDNFVRDIVEREKARRAREILEQQRSERERSAREQADREQQQRQQLERERSAQAERDRAEKERLERERSKREQSAQAEREQAERTRRERAERERIQRQQAERAAQLAREQSERAEKERIARERSRRERLERERAERDRSAREQADRERIQRERTQPQQVESPQTERRRGEGRRGRRGRNNEEEE